MPRWTGRVLALAVVMPALLAPTLSARAAAPAEESAAPRSAIGGERLARQDTQVHRAPGVPALPAELTAKSWIVADAESGEVLAAHDAHRPLPPASTLKMLFADTLLPKFGREERYTALPEHFADMGPGSSAVGISDHHTYSVEDLWLGVFLASGNDAVAALATMNGGREVTVEQMNARARELQAGDTHVINPDGYDADGQVSSAYDLTLFARSGMQNADFREYASTPDVDFPGADVGEDGERETFEVQNTNRLLVGAPGLDPYPGLAGVKNGYTSEAGHTFTGVAEREGRVLLVTVLAPEGDGLQAYRETAELFDWGFAAAGKAEPVGELVPPLSELPADADPDGTGDAAPGEGTGDGKGGDRDEGEAAGLEGAARGAEDGGLPDGVLVLGATAGGLILLAAAAYLFHRRHPLPLRPARRRTDAPPR